MQSINDCKISVVIATLGGDVIDNTIESINTGTVIPNEILLCIPEKEATSITDIQYDNVTVIPTKCRGQVAQRAVGFRKVRNDVVVQLDDDIIIANDCIEKLYSLLMKCDPLTSISPAFFDITSKQSVYKKVINKKWLQALYYHLINGKDGYKMGAVDMTGSGIGVDPENTKKELYSVEWLPGGCVMHHRKNLMLDNFFPLPGKAYCEDLIHSHLLKEKGIALYVSTSAMCYFDNGGYTDCGFLDFMSMLKDDYNARKYYLIMVNKYTFRIFLFYMLMFMNYIKNI